MDISRGYIFLLVAAFLAAPAQAFGEPGTLMVSFDEVLLSYSGGGTLVNVTASVMGPAGPIEYCSLDVLVDGVIVRGECWSDLPGLADANPGVAAPATIDICSLLTLNGEHLVGFRSYARDSLGNEATSEAGPFSWSPCSNGEDGPRIDAEIKAEGGEVKTWLGAHSSSGIQAIEETLIVNGLESYRFDSGSGSLPPSPGLEVERSLALLIGDRDTLQLRLLATSGSGARTLRLVSAPRAATLEEDHMVQVLVCGGGETVPQEGNYTVVEGDIFVIEARPSGGATFLYWLVDGAVSGCEAKLTLPVAVGTRVEAVFSSASEPGLLLLEGVEPGPSPWIVAPQGKVKLTILPQPVGEANITLWPEPGVYLADAGCEVEVRCASMSRDWAFREWCVSMGGAGMARLPGEGRENTARLRLTCDTVVTALHSRRLG